MSYEDECGSGRRTSLGNLRCLNCREIMDEVTGLPDIQPGDIILHPECGHFMAINQEGYLDEIHMWHLIRLHLWKWKWRIEQWVHRS